MTIKLTVQQDHSLLRNFILGLLLILSILTLDSYNDVAYAQEIKREVAIRDVTIVESSDEAIIEQTVSGWVGYLSVGVFCLVMAVFCAKLILKDNKRNLIMPFLALAGVALLMFLAAGSSTSKKTTINFVEKEIIVEKDTPFLSPDITRITFNDFVGFSACGDYNDGSDNTTYEMLILTTEGEIVIAEFTTGGENPRTTAALEKEGDLLEERIAEVRQ